MPSKRKMLKTDRQILNEDRPGYHPIEPNLRLLISSLGRKSFEFRGTNKKTGKIVTYIIGHYPNMSLGVARDSTLKYRNGLLLGKHPKDVDEPQTHNPFEEVASKWFELHREAWGNIHTVQRHRRVIEITCKPLHGKSIETINRQDIANVLKPIWLKNIDTANKAQNTILRIFEYAEAAGIWPDDKSNPADIRKLRNLLPKRGHYTKKAHANIHYEELPSFFVKLRSLPGQELSHLALEMFILTIGGRIAPVISMQFSEIDYENAIWNIPGQKMKGGQSFRVTLCDRALEIVQICAKRTNGGFLFPSKNSKSGHITDAALRKVIREKMGYTNEKLTTYGFKHTFRSWVQDNGLSRITAEIALNHKYGSKVEQAYITTDAINERRDLMNKWESHCLSRVS